MRILNASACQDIACADTHGFPAALALARKADVTLVTVGIDYTIEAETLDRTSLGLPGNQLALVQAAVAAVGASKVIVVLCNGGSLSVDWIKANVPTVVDAFEGGQSGGTALAQILFGDVNPSGVLPYTVYPAK